MLDRRISDQHQKITKFSGFLEEKKFWKDENINDEWKSKNLGLITSRMKGWQLDAFKESYNNKINNGISLFKKKLLEKNKL